MGIESYGSHNVPDISLSVSSQGQGVAIQTISSKSALNIIYYRDTGLTMRAGIGTDGIS